MNKWKPAPERWVAAFATASKGLGEPRKMFGYSAAFATHSMSRSPTVAIAAAAAAMPNATRIAQAYDRFGIQSPRPSGVRSRKFHTGERRSMPRQCPAAIIAHCV